MSTEIENPDAGDPVPEVDQTQVNEALAMGWRPRDQYKGPEDKWVPAAEYIRRGNEVLPIVRSENRKLHGRVESLNSQIAGLTAQLEENRASMGDFVKFQQEMLRSRLDDQRQQLLAARREARNGGDDAQLDRIEEQLEENRDARAKVAATPAPAPAARNMPPAKNPEADPIYVDWVAKNPWLEGNSPEDQARQGAAMRFGQAASEARLGGKAFFDFIDQRLAEAFPTRKAASKMEDGGRHGGSPGKSGAAGFDALPPEAQAHARAEAARFVGPNKVFKDEKSWLTHYAKQYNA